MARPLVGQPAGSPGGRTAFLVAGRGERAAGGIPFARAFRPGNAGAGAGRGVSTATFAGSAGTKRRGRARAVCRQPRRRTVIGSPSRGRRVTSGSGVISRPGTGSNVQWRAIVASASTPSVRAKLLPMHWCGPPPKGK